MISIYNFLLSVLSSCIAR